MEEASLDEKNVRKIFSDGIMGKLEALLIPKTNHFSKIFDTLLNEGANVDKPEFNLNDHELMSQMGLCLMTVSMSNGKRKMLFCEPVEDNDPVIRFAMITQSVFDEIMNR